MNDVTASLIPRILRHKLPLGAACTLLVAGGAYQVSSDLGAPPATNLTSPGLLPPPPPGRDACRWTAFTLHEATIHSARSDYFIGAAHCLNTPGVRLHRCLRQLGIEFREARKHANDQLDARLDLCRLLGPRPYAPDLDPKDFSAKVTNPFFPLKPGRTLVYEKKTKEGTERIEFTTLKRTQEIAGIECAVVHDVVTMNNELVEDTFDWYAQHKDGTVWYIGEIARNYEDGLLDNLDGSWRTDKDGAKPGILMLAKPKKGRTYRQEFLPNEAEDVATVIALNSKVTVPAGSYTKCLQTEDWTPIEPDVRERKFYAKGIGTVLELDPVTTERTELVKIIDK